MRFKSLGVLVVVSAIYTAGPRKLSAGETILRVENRNAVFPMDGGYVARNDGLRGVIRFGNRGFEITPDSGAWRWGLQLQSYGFPGEERGVSHAITHADVEKIGCQWDSTIEEWFVNGEGGLEHGFTLASRPGRSSLPLTLHLKVLGALVPRIASDGRSVSFLDDRGVDLLHYAGLLVTDADGHALGARFIREAQGLRLEVDERNARYPIAIDPTVQLAYLKPALVASTQLSHWFGFSVAVSGDTAVIGAPQEDSSSLGVDSSPNDTAEKAGAAYVFTWTGLAWVQEAYLKPAAVGTTQTDDRFGWSVAISGDTIVVGAIREDGASLGVNSMPIEGATDAGAAYVFTRTGGVWSQQAYLKPAAVGSTQVSDQFGWSVGIDGDTIVVGAYDEASSTLGVNSSPDELAPGAGAAYVFTRTGGVWTQQAYLKPGAVGTTQANDHFGNSVGVSGDTIVVGAFQEDSSSLGVNSVPNELAPASGAAYVFARNAGVWSQEAYLKPAAVGTSQSGDFFGTSVAVSGDTVVVGANGEDSSTVGINSTPNEGSSSSGAAYVFIRNAGLWSQEAYLKPAAVGTSQTFDSFGWSVAISGDSAVVGAIGEDSSTTAVNSAPNESAGGAGAAYVFTRSFGVWSQRDYLKAAAVGTAQLDDEFGYSVAISGDRVAVGAYLEDSASLGVDSTPDEAAADAGAAYLFGAQPLPAALRAKLVQTAVFVQGQIGATFSMTVSNAGGLSNTGQTLVYETVPQGLTLVSMAGNGWTCVGVYCTRFDNLKGSDSYDPITITVNVSATAPASVTNQVSVYVSNTYNDSVDLPTIVTTACDPGLYGTTNVADVQQLTNEALGVLANVHDLNHDGFVNVLDVQKVINAALGQGCLI